MITEFDIPALFYVTFGMNLSPKFNVNAPEIPRLEQESKLGVPLYKTIRGKEYFLWTKLAGIQLPLPVMSIETSNMWAVRRMKNRKGSVKGYLGKDDYYITIRGFCLGPNGLWPEEEIELIRDLDNKTEAVEIENALTALLGIEHVTIMRCRLLEPRGFTGVQAYQMELLSDFPQTFIVEDAK